MVEASALVWQPLREDARGTSIRSAYSKPRRHFGDRRKGSAVQPRIALLALLLAACGQNAPPDPCPSATATDCAQSALGYAAKIAPILDDRCVPCHSSAGQMPAVLLGDYEAVSRERTGITTQVLSCSMPPAFAPALTSDERQQILSWLACGARP